MGPCVFVGLLPIPKLFSQEGGATGLQVRGDVNVLDGHSASKPVVEPWTWKPWLSGASAGQELVLAWCLLQVPGTRHESVTPPPHSLGACISTQRQLDRWQGNKCIHSNTNEASWVCFGGLRRGGLVWFWGTPPSPLAGAHAGKEATLT